MSRPKHRGPTDHQHAADQARQMPGQWVFAGAYNSRASAASTARLVRTPDDRSGRFYGPTGSFAARTELTDDGADLYVRYIADRNTTMPPAADDDRARDFQRSLDDGLTEDLDAFTRRIEAAATGTTRRN